MSESASSKSPAAGRGRANAISVDESTVDPTHVAWVTEFTGAGQKADAKAAQDKKRDDAVKSSTVSLKAGAADLKGLDFELLIRKDANFKAMMLSAVGKQGSMKSLTGTGDAMAEFDTYHDAKKVEALDPATLKKARESLKLVVDASQQLDASLMKLYGAESGLDPKEFEHLGQLRSADRNHDEEERKPGNNKLNGSDAKAERPERSKEDKEKLVKFEKLRAKVEKEVRDEVWQPLVRQGLIPENMVPDIHSEVARTFEGASAEYEERLKKYTAAQGENGELIEKLKLGKKVADQVLAIGKELGGVLPGGEFIKTGVECATILADTSFQVAGQILKKDDALNIAQTVANGVGGLVKAFPEIPEEVQLCITSGLEIALTGGKAVKGIMDGKPGDVLTAVTSGLLQSLTLAAQVSGSPNVELVAKEAAVGLAASPAAAAFITVLQRKDPKPTKQEIQDALAKLITTGITSVETAVADAVKAEAARDAMGAGTAKSLDTAMKLGADAAVGVVDVALTKDKAKALAKAAGAIAEDCCTAFMPGSYGPTVGAVLKKSISGTPKLAQAIGSGKPEEALAVFGDVLGAGLTKGAKDVDDEDVKEGMKDAAKAIKALKAEIKGLAAFEAAVGKGDVPGVKKAAAKIINSLMDPVLAKVDPSALSEDGTLVSPAADDEDEDEDDAGDDDAAAGDADTEAQFQAERRKTIARADAVIKQGGTEEQVAKAKADRDKAVAELLQRATLLQEVEADAKDFADMLDTDLEAEDDGDTRTLERLIKTIQRDRQIMKMADALVGMGLSAAAAFFAPVGIAMDFKTFAVEAAKAVSHLRELLKWKRNAKEARNAVTVQVHTMLNRVGLEEDAVIEHQTKATLALISGVGNIIATAGAHAAPAGVAIAASAKIARASLDLALTIKSAAEMELAWRQYLKALQNPKDRKEIRMTLQKNSTMAKYALVWGALNDENPIAQKALKRCGLTDAIIAKESANVEGVVKYLEVLYQDDPVVLRAVPDMTGWGWKAPKPAVSLQVWTEFLATATDKGKPKLASGSGGAITAAFGALAPARAAKIRAEQAHDRITKFVQAQSNAAVEEEVATEPKDRAAPGTDRRTMLLQAKQQATEKALDQAKAELTAALTGIAKACTAFKPVTADGDRYDRVTEWVVAVASLAELEVRGLDGDDDTLSSSPAEQAA